MTNAFPPVTGAAVTKPKVGCQLIVYGSHTKDEFPEILMEVKAAGYDGVETGNLYDRYPPSEVEDLLNSTGLSISGVHLGYEGIADTDKVKSAIDLLKAVDSRYLMVSGVGDRKQGLAAYDEAIEVFNRAADLCGESGIQFCYHNHAWEFDFVDGQVPIHYLCSRTDPAVLKLCVDVYWVMIGGEDPAQFIRKYSDRIAYFHFKDGSKGTFTELGRGTVDFDALKPEVWNVSPEWITYEQDRTDLDPEESVRISRDFMREKLGL